MAQAEGMTNFMSYQVSEQWPYEGFWHASTIGSSGFLGFWF